MPIEMKHGRPRMQGRSTSLLVLAEFMQGCDEQRRRLSFGAATETGEELRKVIQNKRVIFFEINY
jgi:hypothetical protein